MELPITEEEARGMHYCLGCANPKDVGMVVCWNCFKYRKDKVPFKYFGGTLSDWLKVKKEKGDSYEIKDSVISSYRVKLQ